MSYEHWRRFCFEELGLTSQPHLVDKWWGILERHLGATEARPYHNLSHVGELLNLARMHCPKLSASMGLAIYFHDVIYEPQKGENEERSAALFKEFAGEASRYVKQEWCSPENVSDVYSWIIETKHHTTSTYVSPFNQGEFLLFLDFDMGILGSGRIRYEQYCDYVRREYSHISSDRFRQGRSEFLKMLLATPDDRLYRTEKMRGLFLEKARDNIAQELKRLEQSSSIL